MTKKSTTEEFIEKSVAKHGEKYDYSNVEYENSHTKVKIICKTHGVFEQSPTHHLSGKGCRDCGNKSTGNSRRKHESDFINEAVSIHGDTYDYSNIEYEGINAKIKILCKIHGIFEQSPGKHIRGHGCPNCGRCKSDINRRKSKYYFIKLATSIHSDKYDYSLVEYELSEKKVKITCNTHGVFLQSPNKHIDGRGCPDCGREITANSRRKTESDFVSEAIAIHGDTYDYSNVEYEGYKKAVKIICKTHGEFKQSPGKHLSGQGCSDCSKMGFNKSVNGSLYYIKFESDTELPLYKIGITNAEDVNDRIKTMYVNEGFTSTILKTISFEVGADAYDLEQLLHKEYAEHKYYGDPIMRNGNTELFVKDVMGYDLQ